MYAIKPQNAKPQNAKPSNNSTQRNSAHENLPLPELIESKAQSLGIHSTLSDLPRYTFSVAANYAIKSLIEQFIQFPDLPGVIVLEASQIGVLSRHQFLECWLRLGHTTLFGSGSVRMVLTSENRKVLSVPGNTSVLLGAQQALKRTREQQGDPILVEHNGAFELLDARVLNVAHWQIRGIETQIRYERLQMQLLQSEKMAALGRLVDGVAHEILDPVSFIWGNLSYIDDYAKQQQTLISAYETALHEASPEITQLKQDIEFDYLRSDFPAAVKSARRGAHRLRQLATSLQNFCHIDEVHPRPTDLNTLLDSTLRLLKSRLTSPIEIKRCYGKLPPVPCFSGQLSQVFMNIFTNAIDSLLAQAESYIAEPAPLADASPKRVPTITVTTCVQAAQDMPNSVPDQSRWVSIIISDNGPGLSPEIKAQVIDSFSTARRSRKETGLAMSYQIITAKHGGRFWVRSLHNSEHPASQEAPLPTGTEFEILLPLTSAEDAEH